MFAVFYAVQLYALKYSMPPTLQQEIAAVRLTIEGATKKLKELEARPVVPPKWEPKGGRFIITPRGTARDTTTFIGRGILTGVINDGSAYPTHKSAESALPYITFFKRLCCLAAELNPSGKVGGAYSVFVDHSTRWATLKSGDGQTWPRGLGSIFETEFAVQEAARIMNRDGWKVPTI